MTISELNAAYAIPGLVQFEPGQGGLARMAVTAAGGAAHVYLHGAHVTHWQPAGQAPVLWLGRKSWFEPGKPIRGGVPICFPWFGQHPDDPNKPLHGFVRLAEWDVLSVIRQGERGLTATLGTKGSAETEHHTACPFELRYTVTVDEALVLTLEARNVGHEPLTVTEALHSYFCVADVRKITISGLERTTYLDGTDDRRPKEQDNRPITFAGETNRVYLNTQAECRLIDPGLERTITVAKSGSLSTVVWNPWAVRAAAMPDFGDEEWTGMVCIETANAATNAVRVPPGGRRAVQVRVACSKGP